MGASHPKNCFSSSRNAVCVFEPANGIAGTILFHQCSPHDPVSIYYELTGPPSETHAIHIHEYGDLRQGCASLGDHYNPYGQTHGSARYNMPRHAGDLINNIRFDQAGRFRMMTQDTVLCLFRSGGIYGRSVVIHQDEDDLGRGGHATSLTTGNSGKRIQYAVIAICKPTHF